MKKILMSVHEFYSFKSIAKFFFEASYSKNVVIVQADAKLLEAIGY